MIKHYINKIDKVPKGYFESFLDPEVCANYDPLPSKTPLETILELQAGAEIRDNNLRKLYFGEQNDDPDMFAARDKYEEFMQQKIQRFQASDPTAQQASDPVAQQASDSAAQQASENLAQKASD